MPFDSFLLLWIPFVGGLIGWLLAANAQRTFKVPKDLILVFSGAFLLAIVVLELLPVVYTATDKKMGYWILLGIFIQSFLEYFSRGAEHGHIHLDKLQKFPLLLWLSLCIHAFIEGFPLVDFPHLAWGMFVHKIPIAFVIYLLLQKTNTSPIVRGLSLLLFVSMTTLGGLSMAYLDTLKAISLPLLGVVVGVILHIATTIIFESNEGHRFQGAKLACILGAVLLALLL